MTIEKLKKALVEVADICEKNTCFSCPFSFFNEDTDEFDCPLWDAAVDVRPPEEWRGVCAENTEEG